MTEPESQDWETAYKAWNMLGRPHLPDAKPLAELFARHRIAATAEKDAEIARLKSVVINLIGALEMENPLPWRGTINEAENALGENQ